MRKLSYVLTITVEAITDLLMFVFMSIFALAVFSSSTYILWWILMQLLGENDNG